MRFIGFSFALALCAGFAAPAEAARIKGAFVGCLTKGALDEFVTAATRQDHRQMKALIGATCLPIEGLEYSLVDRGFVKSQIRVYVGQRSALLWTVSEAVR